MGDLNKRRGRVLGMIPVAGGKQVIEADIPMTGLFGYCDNTSLHGQVEEDLTNIHLQDMSRLHLMYRRKKLLQEQKKHN